MPTASTNTSKTKTNNPSDQAENLITDLTPRISVIGVGGAGGNAVNNMIKLNLEGVDFMVCNTDAQALKYAQAKCRIQLGHDTTQGLGAGSKPDVGRASAEESMEEIVSKLEGNHMIFITAGMGGGTGTGAAPVIARAARERGILTVGVVTKPFHFEGSHRMRTAERGIEELQQYVDTLIIIPNQNLFRIANEHTTFADAFSMADNVLYSGVRGVTDLMVMPGLINLDFADIRAVMSEMGKAMMGTGEAEGEGRAIAAAEAAISNPLLDDVSMRGAKGVLINITGGGDMTLFEVDEAANRIRDEIESEANIIFGSAFDQSMTGRMRVSIVATGIDARESVQTTPQVQSAPLQAPRPVTQPAVAPQVTPIRPNPLAHNPLAMERPRAPQVQPISFDTQEPTSQFVTETQIEPDQQVSQMIHEAALINPTALDTAFSSDNISESSPEQQELLLIDDTRPQPYERKIATPQAQPISAPQVSMEQPKKAFSFLGRFAAPARGSDIHETTQQVAAAPQFDSFPAQSMTETIVGNTDYRPHTQVQESMSTTPENLQTMNQYTIPAAPQGAQSYNATQGSSEISEDQLDIPAFLRRKPTR